MIYICIDLRYNVFYVHTLQWILWEVLPFGSVNSNNSTFLHTLSYTKYSLLQKGQKFIKAQEAIKIYDPNVFKTFNPLKFENKLTYLAINIPLRFI